MLHHYWKYALLSLMMLAAGPNLAETLIGKGISLNCQSPEADQVHCRYRLLKGGSILSATAHINNIQLSAPSYAARDVSAQSTAILFLVDTSDPARKLAVAKAAAHIRRILDSATAQQRFALASFDSEMKILAPLGSNLEQIRAAAATLKATGRTTELYRNIVQALQQLAPAQDEQRILVIFSDGLAEDRAYFNNDVVHEALRQDIAIYGLGYPRSVALSVGLQSLRRLADETGGRFVAANQAQELPESFLEDPFSSFENGGALSIDITGVNKQVTGAQTIRLVLETNSGPVSANIPITLAIPVTAPIVRVVEVPKIIKVPTIVEKTIMAPRPAAPIINPIPQVIPAQVVPLWYWIAAVGVLGLALLILLLVLWSKQRGAPAVLGAPSSDPSPPALTTLATLSFLNADGESHAIHTVTYRIGRLADNDLVVQDNSVSRHHAEIRRGRDGKFTLIDLDSMNGVFVNGKKIRESALKEADILEIGDVRLTFSTDAGENFQGEETVMLKTVLPDRSLDGLVDTNIDKRSAATDDTIQ